MENFLLTKKQARRFLLKYQELLPPRALQGKCGILDFIDRVGCIQYDPLNIAGYNHELILNSRISNFQSEMLQEMLYEDRSLLDGWDKNMSIYKTTDWPYFRRFRASALQRLGDQSRPIIPILSEVRKEITERGPLSSRDLKFNKIVDWSWAPTSISRAALESMYFWGELIVHHKLKTKRVYDFTEKHLPHGLLSSEEPHPEEFDFHTWYIRRRIGSIGLMWNKASDAWLGMPKIKSSERSKIFEKLLMEEKICLINIENIDVPFYTVTEAIPLIRDILAHPNEEINEARASVIAPLDNLIWDRKLIKELFNFKYIWEVYKPETEREYGYYVLPILYGDSFVARFEPGKNKITNKLVIKNWWWEEDALISEEMKAALNQCFKEFVRFLKVKGIEIEKRAMRGSSLKWLKI